MIKITSLSAIKSTFATLIFSLGFLIQGCGDDSRLGVIVDPPTETEEEEITASIQLGSGAGSEFATGALNITENGEDNWIIEASVVDEDNVRVTGSYSVSFTSTCVQTNYSTLSSSSAVTSAGFAQITYTDQGCTNIDTLVATVTSPEGIVVQATGEIDTGESEFIASSSSSSEASSSSSSSGEPVAGMNIAIGNTDLEANASTNITLSFLDEDNAIITGTGDFTVTSPCTTINNSTIAETTVTDSSITYTYTAAGCTGDDTISVSGSWNGVNYSGQASINVEGDTVSFLQWVSTEPASIAIKGSGGNEAAVVTFSVNGQSGEPIVGEAIDFRIEGESGGLTLVNSNDISDASGQVQARVRSGSTPTNVTIVARHEGTGEETPSNGLVVATGLAADQHFNIVLDVHNPKAYNRINYQPINVTVAVTDKSGNPVADGTIVNFVSEEGGAVTPSCATVDNSCTVVWKPDGRDTADGRYQIFATVKGTEDYVDNNGNKIFDDGDTFTEEMDLAEPYSDNNQNGIYDQGEHFVDSNGDGMRTAADGLWNGLNCQDSTRCSLDKTFVDLGAQITVHATSSTAVVCEYGDFDDTPRVVAAGGTLSLTGLYLSDGNPNTDNDAHPCPSGNPPAAGTTIEFSIDGDASLLGTTSFVVPDNAIRPLGGYSATIKGSALTEDGSALLILKVTVPDEPPIEWSWSVTVDAP